MQELKSNILGFLDLSEVSEKYKYSGNVGMLDIVAALEWIQTNIRQFGGDPDNVTIFGESGGGGKVGTLMCMPSAKGLFHKAIIMSGTILNVNTNQMSKELGKAVLKELGISEKDIDRIKDVPYQELYSAGQRAMAASIGTRRPGTPMMWGFGPTPDGEVVLQSRYHVYPILDEHERVVGVLTRYHLLRPRRKRVVLVDHNEAAQSVPGLEEAEILEIIDHHRLADIQTGNPIYVRNEPVGSTNTIIAGMFQERGLFPSDRMAGLLASAIVSDTVMFKSPTCTERDRIIAERMARIAGVSLKDLGKEIFSSSRESKSIEELLMSDFKEFHIAGHSLAVAQITSVDTTDLFDRREDFLLAMTDISLEKNYEMLLLMLTDVLLDGTWLLFVGDEEAIRNAFSVQPREGAVFLPHVMSRKKQVIPSLSALWG